jgi:hypothetical protein
MLPGGALARSLSDPGGAAAELVTDASVTELEKAAKLAGFSSNRFRCEKIYSVGV